MSPRFYWLVLYILFNIIAYFTMLSSGELIGDVAGNGNSVYDNNALLIAALLVILAYLVILWPGFNAIYNLKIGSMKIVADETYIGCRIGKLLAVLQISYLLFIFAEGINIAGSMASTSTDSYLSVIFVLIPVDMLFFIYYGFYRTNKYFYPNLFIWTVSNFMRGWAGHLMFIMFFEWCRMKRKGKVNLVHLAAFGVLLAISYPLIRSLKWVIRARTSSSLYDLISMAFNTLEGYDYLLFVKESFVSIIERLQVVSNVVEVMRLRHVLSAEFYQGNFRPFWMEGLHGVIYDRLFVGHKTMPVGVAITQFLDTNWEFDIGNWNTNIGYVGWFFIEPYYSFYYIVYTFMLGFLSVYLLKKLGPTELSKDMLWCAWLFYLMPPWLGVFVNFIYALLVFLGIKYLVNAIPKPAIQKSYRI